MADWAATDFRKLYVVTDPSFERLPYAARAMGADIIRRCDRAGNIVKVTDVTSHASLSSQVVSDVAFALRAHSGEEIWIRMALESLLKDGYLVVRNGYLTIRNYVEAQRSSSAERMARKRARETPRTPPNEEPSHPPSDVTLRTVRHSDESDQEERRGEEKDPPISPDGFSAGEPVGLREIARRAFGEGIRSVVDGPPFTVLESEADVLVRVIGDDLRWSGLRGEQLAQVIRKSAADYARERGADAKFERGLSPSKWAEWRRSSPTTTSARVDRSVQKSNAVQEELMNKFGANR